jgi:hypothetical protein
MAVLGLNKLARAFEMVLNLTQLTLGVPFLIYTLVTHEALHLLVPKFSKT